ncbi:MAG TPA: PQQ-binding-like beta-propeller repeat protein [Pyrinomonadaceae bacterium]|jgi:outer membrane protein assembly factor BamB
MLKSLKGLENGKRPESKVWLRGMVAAILLLFVLWQLNQASPLFPGPAEGRLALSQPLTLRWQYSTDSTINLTPATDGERIYLPLAAGMIVSLRASDGQLLWRTEIGGEFSASPVADDMGVYIASETGVVHGTAPRAAGALRALGRQSGVTLWMHTLPFPLRGALAMNERTLFGGASDGKVYAVSKRSGQILWTKQFSTPFLSIPTISGSYLLLGNDDGTLVCLEQETGKQLWRYRTRGPVRGRASVRQGIVYFGSADGYVYAVDKASGRFRWRTRTGAGVQAVTVTEGGLLVASLDNFVYSLSLDHGNRLWKRQLAGRIAAQPLAATDGALFTPLSGDTGVVLDLHDGKQLNSIPIGEDNTTAASPIVVNDVLFVTTRQGLLAFSRPV